MHILARRGVEVNLVIGIDTGGTYTDAVLLDKASGQVLNKSKAVTTPHDLSIGITRAIEGLGEVAFGKVRMVSISTTLATNAIVEGQGGRVGLLLIGYDREVMDQQGLAKKLPVESMYYIEGGHDVKGDEMCALDTRSVRQAVIETKDVVDAYAVSGYFSVMNPDHELQTRHIIEEITNAPVVCGHEITNKLNALKRVSTVVLNARLLPLVKHLMDSVSKVLMEKGCKAALMVVKGDGTLISEKMARQRPVETILSGPAASAIGAQFLAGISEAIVVDMGGTTTDIAILQNGLPWNNPAGATVGGWQTCVQAADLRTIGIGGDSHIQIKEGGDLTIGPGRAIPLLRLGEQFPKIYEEIRKLATTNWNGEKYQPTDYYTYANSTNGLSISQAETKLIDALRQRPLPVTKVHQMMGDRLQPVERLEALGVIRKSGVTPTDVLWKESAQEGSHVEASQAGVEVYARWLKISKEKFAELVREEVMVKIAKEILDKVFSNQTSHSLNGAPREWAKLLDCLLGREVIADISGTIQVHKPIIALGAPVASFIPGVAGKLHTQCIIPEHAEVGNAVGAAVAGITHCIEILVQPQLIGTDTLKYLVHTPAGREMFNDLEEAVRQAERIAREMAIKSVVDAGGHTAAVRLEKHEVNMGMLKEVTLRAIASDRLSRTKPQGRLPRHKESTLMDD